MIDYSDRAITQHLVENILPGIAGKLTASSSLLDEEALYQSAVAEVVDMLLAPIRTFSEAGSAMLADFGPFDPEQVGRIYQRLRSFRLDLGKTGRPMLVPCIRGRRNQGLFYTPESVVRYIVSHTLDGLNLSDPLDFLNVKIVDPAAGTGIFLAEALDELAQRVLNRLNTHPGLLGIIQTIQSRFAERLFGNSSAFFPDNETAVRLHLIENCLYGVDSDPTAIAIAKRVLLKRAFSSGFLVNDLKTNLRVGNALIGKAIPSSTSKESENRLLASVGLPTGLIDQESLTKLDDVTKLFHWPLEFHDAFAAGRGGFDAVIGNPPYEIVSVRESGISDRTAEQRYYRASYRTCKGKINVYRLMMERGLSVLRNGGVLGFIVPGTLLADSTAEPLRREILDQTEVLDAVVIPEKARVFEGVTQALLIIIARKGGCTRSMSPSFWYGDERLPLEKGPEISRGLMEKTGLRIALIRSEEEGLLLQALLRHPPLGGDAVTAPVGTVHQGEVNLATHRRFITDERTEYPLIRGEHVTPLVVLHPAAKRKRLDWVTPDFFKALAFRRPGSSATSRDFSRFRGSPWEKERIVLGRVVNMATRRRLKAALVPPGVLLGDMTNFIADPGVPSDYLLGLCNSSLLNWRLKITSANNYLSAAEIEALPIPRLPANGRTLTSNGEIDEQVRFLLDQSCRRPEQYLKQLDEHWSSIPAEQVLLLASMMIRRLVHFFLQMPVPGEQDQRGAKFWNLLDAVVFRLYGVEEFAGLDIFCC